MWMSVICHYVRMVLFAQIPRDPTVVPVLLGLLGQTVKLVCKNFKFHQYTTFVTFNAHYK